jgi:hypothetical protein
MTPPMTSAYKSMLIRVAGVAALLLGGLLTPHSASAQTPHNLAPIEVRFAYHPGDPAEAIYAHLAAQAHDACASHGSRSLRMQAYETACARNLLTKAVTRIGRADLAELNGADVTPLAIAAR